MRIRHIYRSPRPTGDACSWYWRAKWRLTWTRSSNAIRMWHVAVQDVARLHPGAARADGQQLPQDVVCAASVPQTERHLLRPAAIRPHHLRQVRDIATQLQSCQFQYFVKYASYYSATILGLLLNKQTFFLFKSILWGLVLKRKSENTKHKLVGRIPRTSAAVTITKTTICSLEFTSVEFMRAEQICKLCRRVPTSQTTFWRFIYRRKYH